MLNDFYIQDTRALARWLEGKPPRFANLIAIRVALRLLPLIGRVPDAFTGKENAVLLQMFRCFILLDYKMKFSIEDLTRAIKSLSDLMKIIEPFFNFGHDYAGYITLHNILYLIYMDMEGSDKNKSKNSFFESIKNSAAVLAKINPDGDQVAFWDAITIDIKFLQDSDENNIGALMILPLWPDEEGVPPWILKEWDNLKSSPILASNGFDFWLDWYAGKVPLPPYNQITNTVDPILLNRIATSSDEWWGQPPAVINRTIGKWKKKIEENAKKAAAATAAQPSQALEFLPPVFAEVRKPDHEDKLPNSGPPLADGRFKLIVDNRRLLENVAAKDCPGLAVVGTSARFSFAAVARTAGTPEDVFETSLNRLAERLDARSVQDRYYQLESTGDFDADFGEAVAEESGVAPAATLADVVKRINADGIVYPVSNRVVIAIIDTGIHGDRREFAMPGKQAGGWSQAAIPPLSPLAPWRDDHGHGTMCALIAAGSDSYGGRFSGVAPQTPLYACRVPGFVDADLVLMYDRLIDSAERGEVIIASHSFGVATGAPPAEDPSLMFPTALQAALDAGVHAVFSAGNYHLKAGGVADGRAPNSIWLHKGMQGVLTVGTCDLEGGIWDYSSRGPGQFPDRVGHGPKPDVVAPTPRNGLIGVGGKDVVMPDGWGSSGAAPQVAALLAILLSTRADIPRDELYDIIRDTAVDLGLHRDCQGAGMIDCRAALERVKVWNPDPAMIS